MSSRSKREVHIKNYSILEVNSVVKNWLKKNKFKIFEETPNCIYARWGTGILTAAKYLEITLDPTEDGVIAQIEGYIIFFYLFELDFNAPHFFRGGIPRREGARALERLVQTLEAL